MTAPLLRIAFDATLLATATPSGVEHAVRASLNSLLSLDQDRIIVYAASDLAETTPGLDRAKIHFAPLATGGRAGRILWQQTVLPRLLRRHGADLLFAPGYVAPLRAPCPVVLSVYDLIALDHPGLCKPANALHYRLAMPRSIRRAAAVIAPSEYVRGRIIARFPCAARRVHVLPIPLRPAPPLTNDDLRATAARLRLPPRFVLYAGNIEPKKSITTLVRAFAHMRRQGATTHPLVLAGRWAWKCRDVEQAIQQEGIGEHIVRLGYVPGPGLSALMRLADIFVFPSIEEGFGLPPLEAMTAGVPVVASTAASLPEVLGDAALLVPPLDTAQLAAAMTKVLNNTFLRASLIQRGLARAAQLTALPHAERLRKICGVACQP